MEIKIGKPARECHVCGRTFEHEEELRSLLRRGDESEFVREDHCLKCWPEVARDAAFSTWAPVFYDPAVAEQQPPEVFSPLRKVFYESLESQDRETMAVAFLAAQLLRRQKVFRLIKQGDDAETGINIALFSDRIGNQLIEVRDPSLTFTELEHGRFRLMKRLEELETPVTEEEANDDGRTEEE